MKKDVLYLYAGSRKDFFEKWKKGLVPDTQLLGLNYMEEFGIGAEFKEWKLSEVLRKINFNLVHLPYIFTLKKYKVVFICAGLPLVYLSKCILRMKSPKFVIYNTYLTNALKRNAGTLRYIVRKAIENIDVIVCTAKTQVDFLIKKGFDPKKIVFVPIGIDVQFFEKQIEQTRQPARLTSEKYILSVGRDLGRDYKTLFEAIIDLPIKLKVATKKEAIEGLVIPSNVEILFHVPYEDMPSLYKDALFVVTPLKIGNRHEGSDTSGQYGYLEPMSMGKAVIVSDKAEVRDYIEDGVSGILVEPENPGALRDSIKKLLSDEAIHAKIGTEAQKIVQEKFSSRNFASALSIIFQNYLR